MYVHNIQYTTIAIAIEFQRTLRNYFCAASYKMMKH